MSDLSDSNEDGGQMATELKKAFNGAAAEKAKRDALKLMKKKAGIVETDTGKKKLSPAQMERELSMLRKRLEQRELSQGSGDPLADLKEQIGGFVKKTAIEYYSSILTKDYATAQAMLFTAVWMARSNATSACYRGRTLDRLVREVNRKIANLEKADQEGSETMDLVSNLPFAKDGQGGISSQEADGSEVIVSAVKAARQRKSALELDRVTTLAILHAARAFHDKYGVDAWQAPDRGPRDGVAQPGDLFGFGK